MERIIRGIQGIFKIIPPRENHSLIIVQRYHSIKARGERVKDVLDAATKPDSSKIGCAAAEEPSLATTNNNDSIQEEGELGDSEASKHGYNHDSTPTQVIQSRSKTAEF